MAARKIYRVLFHDPKQAYELYARSVSSSALAGFVELEGLLFGEKSALVVDPSEEALRVQFAGVQRIFVPFHAVTRIDEVEKEGQPRVSARPSSGEGSPIAPFPVPPKH